jgi:hypothetical protein
MSRRSIDKGNISGRFVAVRMELWRSKAWRRTSHGAKILYIALLSRYRIKAPNNGHIYLSHRDAMKELRSDRKQIARWYHELVHYGFIVMTRGASLGFDGKGKAPHWRLTELPYEDVIVSPDGRTTRVPMPAPNDFLLWDGTAFKNKTPGAKTPPAWGRKHPHMGGGENTPTFDKSGGENTPIYAPTPGGENASISRYTTSITSPGFAPPVSPRAVQHRRSRI